MKPALLFAVLSLAVSAGAQTAVYNQTVNAAVPDGNPTGLASTTQVSGLFGNIQDIRLTLDISGGYNGDLYAYLSHGNGLAILLNRPGKTASDPLGYGDPGMSITFSDLASLDIHTYGGNGGVPLTGTWQPDGRNVDPQQVFDTSVRSAMLSSFVNQDPNGSWTLFVADMAGGYQSTLVDWSLQIDVVPEPTVTQLMVGMGSLLGVAALVRRRSKIRR